MDNRRSTPIIRRVIVWERNRHAFDRIPRMYPRPLNEVFRIAIVHCSYSSQLTWSRLSDTAQYRSVITSYLFATAIFESQWYAVTAQLHCFYYETIEYQNGQSRDSYQTTMY